VTEPTDLTAEEEERGPVGELPQAQRPDVVDGHRVHVQHLRGTCFKSRTSIDEEGTWTYNCEWVMTGVGASIEQSADMHGHRQDEESFKASATSSNQLQGWCTRRDLGARMEAG